MMKITKSKKRIIIVIIILALLLIGGMIIMLGKHFVNINGKHLESFRDSSGGGMNGGNYSRTIKKYDEKNALISTQRADWYFQDPEVHEYLVDVSVMDELESVIRKNKMNFWDRKVFSKMFVADGENYSYSFDFGTARISFSSQVYPQRYRNKLYQLDEVILKYQQETKELPGLVNPRVGSEEYFGIIEGVQEIYVYSYVNDYLGIRIMNGMDEILDISNGFKIINTDTDEIIEENKNEYTNTVYPKSSDEKSFALKKRLEEGNYNIVLGELEIPFEIR